MDNCEIIKIENGSAHCVCLLTGRFFTVQLTSEARMR